MGTTHDHAATLPRSPGYLHELGLYGSDEEFRALIQPFALGGLEADEPVVFAYDEHKTDLLQAWLPDTPGLTYVTDAGPYATPTKALSAWRDVVEQLLAGGAQRVRIAGNVPHEGYGRPFVGWDRYEAALDHALGDLPVWAPCLYDVRLAPPDVIEAAKRLHEGVLDTEGRHHPNEAYRGPGRLSDFRRPAVDPLELTAPTAVLDDAAPATIRAAIRDLAEGVLNPDRTDALLLATSEALANALLHGSAPVQARLWATESAVHVHVHDHGEGPSDPLVGLLPGTTRSHLESGRGMWILHNLDLDVSLDAGEDGYTVRLRAERSEEPA